MAKILPLIFIRYDVVHIYNLKCCMNSIYFETGLDNKGLGLVASWATTYENLVARREKLVARMKKAKTKLILCFMKQCSTTRP